MQSELIMMAIGVLAPIGTVLATYFHSDNKIAKMGEEISAIREDIRRIDIRVAVIEALRVGTPLKDVEETVDRVLKKQESLR